MPYYRACGEIPRKRHTQFRRPDGGLYSEELMGQEGFSSESALLVPPAPSDGGDARSRRGRTPPVSCDRTTH